LALTGNCRQTAPIRGFGAKGAVSQVGQRERDPA
ncbi:MAG: hypothetical protein ACI81O_001944, partial [Cyclobacteriaceae bacterium]